MKIVTVTDSISRAAGGLYTSVRRCSSAMADLGHEVSVLSLEDEFSAADIAAWGALEPQLFQKRYWSSLGYSPELKRTLRGGDYDLVHQHGIWLAISAQVNGWKKSTGRPVVISPRGMLDPWALQNSALKKKIAGKMYENSNLRNASCLHALNKSEAESIRKFGLSNPIAVIPNGTDLPDTQIKECPTWWGDVQRKTLFFIARLHPKKGVSELIEAWRLLHLEHPKIAKEWRLVIAGWDDGGHMSELHDQFVESGLSENDLLFPGALHGEEKERAFSNADAFILPSFSEGLPIAVLEAWSWKLPVFMTNECNLPEGFDFGAAIQISQNPTELSRTLAANLSRTDLPEFGDRGRELAESQFTWQGVGMKLDSLYSWLLEGGVPPDFVYL